MLGAGEMGRHVVQRRAQLGQLVARGRGSAHLEVAFPDAARDPGQLMDRPDHDAAHADREHHRRRRDREEPDQDLPVALCAHLGEDRLHGGRHAHHRPHPALGAVTPLALLLVRDGLVQREERDAVVVFERLLRLHRLDGAGEERARHRAARLAAHLLDGRDHVLGQLRLLAHLAQRLEVGEGLDAVAPEHGEAFHGRRALEVLDQPPRDVRPLLEHGRLDAGHDRRDEAARGHLALLDEEVALALDGEHGGRAEADDQHDHDEQRDLGREAEPEHVGR